MTAVRPVYRHAPWLCFYGTTMQVVDARTEDDARGQFADQTRHLAIGADELHIRPPAVHDLGWLSDAGATDLAEKLQRWLHEQVDA